MTAELIQPQGFADQNDTFALQAAQLERRRALAKQLVTQAMSDTGNSGMAGNVYMVGNQYGNLAKNLGGAAMNYMTDDAEKNLQVSQNAAQNQWQTEFNAADTPEAKQQLLAQARNQGLRYDLEKGFADQEARQIEAGEQAAANRVEKADEAASNRAFLEQQKELDRQNRIDLKKTPTVQIYQGGGRGGAGSIKPPSGYRYNEDGTALEPIPGGPKDPANAKPVADKPLNENQGNAVLYGSRAGESHKVLETVGTDYSPMKLDIARASENVPGGTAVANATLTSKEQQVNQAQRDFINAVLRRESGAAIATSEFDNARRQYFPQPNDKPEVIAQKKANRELVIKGLAEVSGPAGKKAIEAMTPTVKPASAPTGRLKFNPATGKVE